MEIQKSKFSCVRDGLVIRGREYRTPGDRLPIAIVCHGFMATQRSVTQYAKHLAEHGYAAFTFDFNGGCLAFGKSDGKTTEMSVLSEVRDLMTVLDYACALPYTDETDILLMGCSQGGFVSALTAAKLKDAVKKLVLFYPALCIPDDARRGHMMFAKFDPHNPPEIIRCGPMKLGKCYVETVIGMNPFAEIAPYVNDVLIVHGTADKIVNVDYSRKAAAAYRESRAERNVEYYEIDGGAHMFSKKHDKIAIEYLTRFVRR